MHPLLYNGEASRMPIKSTLTLRGADSSQSLRGGLSRMRAPLAHPAMVRLACANSAASAVEWRVNFKES